MIALRLGMPVREVVPGDPGRVLSLATQLLSIAAGFDQSARAFTPSSTAWLSPIKVDYTIDYKIILNGRPR